jgi:hypothetical protein
MTNRFLQVFLGLTLAALSCTALGQQPNPKSEARLESLFKAGQMPFVKIGDSHYAAVVTTDDGVSDRFHVFLSTIGNDPNDEALQVIQMVLSRRDSEGRDCSRSPDQEDERVEWYSLQRQCIHRWTVSYLSKQWMAVQVRFWLIGTRCTGGAFFCCESS